MVDCRVLGVAEVESLGKAQLQLNLRQESCCEEDLECLEEGIAQWKTRVTRPNDQVRDDIDNVSEKDRCTNTHT